MKGIQIAWLNQRPNLYWPNFWAAEISEFAKFSQIMRYRATGTGNQGLLFRNY
jgi:hypothetical protein